MTEALPTAVLTPDRGRKLRIAYTCIWYPVAMGRYISDALLRRSDVELWTAGPYTGRWIPWQGGMYLPQSYVYKPDLAQPLDGSYGPQVAYATLEAKCPWQPDLWIEANAGLRTIGRPKQPYIVIGTDPHVLDYSGARRAADMFFSMQKPYMQAGDYWLPYGYDPYFHSQTVVPIQERAWDVSLIGLPYPQRQSAMNAFAAKGRKTHLENGPAYEDAKAIYHWTKVGLNWSSMQDTTARVFEIMAFGIAPLLNRVPDLVEMFQEGRDFEGFASLEECTAKGEALLNDLARCEALGRAARIAVEAHTWDNRVTELLRTAGLVNS